MSQSKVWLISDPHLGHEKVALARGFKSLVEHNNHIFSEITSKVNPNKDTLIILGDVAFGLAKDKYFLKNFFKAKVVRCVMGNHDKPNYMPDHWQLLGSHQEGSTLLTHLPVHTFELAPMGRWERNIHGHHHGYCPIEDEGPGDDRYKCVSLERTDKRLVLLKDVIAEMKLNQEEPPEPDNPTTTTNPEDEPPPKVCA